MIRRGRFSYGSSAYPCRPSHIFVSATHRLGGAYMKENIEERACNLAVYMIENRATVRAAAKKFGISKSTVHMEVTI